MKPEFIDHISVIVSDIKKTANFYSQFLDEPVQMNEEKVVYQIGATKIYFRLPFTAWSRHDKDASGLNHLAFGVKSMEELKRFETVLNEAEIKNSGVTVSKMGKEFIWFDDPDGIRLEFYHDPGHVK